MKKAIFRKFTIVLISLIFLIYPIKILNGCGPGVSYPEDDFHFILNQELLSAAGYEPFFLYYGDSFYPYEDTLDSKQNIDEWYEYFQKKISKENVTNLVYGYPHAELQGILNHIQKGHKSNVATDVLLYFNQTKDEDIINYLLFVRDLQPNVEGMNQWEGCAHDLTTTENYFLTGEQLLKKSKSDFLKLRIAYQLARLAHYAGDYNKCISYFDNYIQPLNSNSCIMYWALGHKAGSLKALGNLPEATYLFSLVFANSPDKRNEAYKSIWFRGEAYEQAFTFCKNDQEKLTLLFMNALEHPGPYMEGLVKLFEINPASKELEVLVMREVKKMESTFTKSDFFYEYSEGDNSSNTLKTLKDFIFKIASTGTARTPPLWYFLSGYISYLTKDYGEAVKFIDKANVLSKDDLRFKNQARIVKTIIAIDAEDTITREFENKILQEFTWLDKMKGSHLSNYYSNEFSKAKSYFLERLMLRYEKNGAQMKAALCMNMYSPIYLKSTMNEGDVDAFITFIGKKNKSPMEIFLGQNFQYTLNQLNEIKGMLALRRGEFKKAVRYLKTSDQSIMSSGDPFEFSVNICITCNNEDLDSPGYTKLGFAEKMLELETQAKIDKVKAANNYFMIGLGLFNTTYFGSSWDLLDYERRAYRVDGVHTDCSKSLEYFLKVMELTKDKELAAKACYMAAKCEQNNSGDVLTGSNGYFSILKQNYSETQYYNEVIEQCKYFNYFVSNK
jgi:hypothetical protein